MTPPLDTASSQTPSDWVALHARSDPQRVALIDGETRHTWASLHELVDRMTAGLVEAGVGPGDAVATLLPNSAEMVVVLLATLRCGAVALPMNPQYKQSEIETILGQARPKAIFAASPLVPMVADVLRMLGVDAPLRAGVPEGNDGWRPYAALVEAARTPAPLPRCSGEEPALWLYSSGSTGGSKKVSRTRAQLAAEAVAFHATAQTTAADIILCAVPLSHAHGLGNGLVAATFAGATLVVHDRFDRRRFLESAEGDRVSIIPGSPFMFKVLAETRLEREPDLSRVRLCFTSGAPLAPEVFEACRKRFHLDIRQLYGSTETGAATLNLSADVDATCLSVGLPLSGVEIEVFDDEGRKLPPGREGAIGIRSPAMFDGYESDELNAQALRHGYFFAGDRGHKDVEGRIYITGRDTLFINLAGNKVDPGEVERVLNAHPKVVESVVLGVRQGAGDEIVKAVVVAREPCEASELLSFCRGRIADFKLPRLIEFRDEIPRNPLGKVLRKYMQ